MSVTEITFRTKSPWQKDDCMGNSNGGCSNESTLEAVGVSAEGRQANIRCCNNEACKARAKEMARQSIK